MNMRGSILRIGAMVWIAAGLPTLAATPVETHGALRIANGTVVDKSGTPTQLAGMSLFWSGWAGQFYNRKTVSWLASNWNVSVVRAAIGVDGSGNYLDSLNNGAPANLKRADSVIQAAIDNGIYVIIDWHDHYAINHTAKSVEFFQRMATKWGQHPNVIYEIYNEPMGSQAKTATTPAVKAIPWAQIEAYSDTVIAAIRAIDASNLVLVGNPSWDQNPSIASGSFLNDKYTNLAYTLHFYAGSHGAALREEGNAALDAGLALFLSEWGTSNADGGGGTDKKVYLAESQAWLDWAKTRNLSWCNWSVVNKSESSAALLPIAGARGWWDDTVISPSGLWVRDQIRALNWGYTYPAPPPPDKPDTASIPGRLQAEGFVGMQGVQSESGADEDQSDDVGYIENGDWADYAVNVTSSSPLYFHARVASAGLGGNLLLLDEAGTTLATISVSPTGGWQKWTTLTDSANLVTLPVGLNRLRLSFQSVDPTATKSLFNLNWVELNGQIDPVRKTSRGAASWRFSNGTLEVAGLDKNCSQVSVRDLAGHLVAQSTATNGSARLTVSAKGILFAETTSPGGREVRRILGN